MELERRLAAFKQVEAVVVFQSGFTANAGTVSSILGKEDIVISDSLNHASIIDGCRLSRAAIKVFPHKDVDAARAILKDLPAGPRMADIGELVARPVPLHLEGGHMIAEPALEPALGTEGQSPDA